MSYHSGFILGAQSVLSTGAGLHSAYAKSLVANNLLHAADCHGQVRVCMMPKSGAYATFRASPVVNTYYKILQFGPFPVHAGSGNPTLRYRLAGHSQTGSEVRFMVVWASGTKGGDVTKNARAVSTTSTTAAWLTSASNPLVFDSAQLDPPITQSAKDSVGGNATSMYWSRSYITVWAYTTNSACEARLDGLYAAEFGPL